MAAVLAVGCSVEPIDEEGATDEPDEAGTQAELDEGAPYLTDLEPIDIQLMEAHDYDDLRYPVTVTWDVDAEFGETVAADTKLLVTVANDAAQARAGTVLVRSYGLDDRTEVLEVGPFELAPGTASVLELPLSELPLQVVGAPSEISIVVEVDNGSLGPIAVPTDPKWVAFGSDYESAVVAEALDQGSDPRLTTRALLEQQVAPTGRIIEDDAARYIVQPGGAEPTGLPAPFPIPSQIPLPDPNPARLCANWRVEFSDPMSGQDALNGVGIIHPDASYAFARVSNNGATTYWEGYLDQWGCTPFIDDLMGTVRVDVETRLNDSPTAAADHDVLVRDVVGAGGAIGVSSALLNLIGTGGTINVNTTNNERRTRAAAVMSAMMTNADLRIWTDSTAIYADQNCGASAGCQSGESIRLGTTPTGFDLTRSRHITGHEYGHLYQRLSFGLFGGGYDDLTAATPFCRCDHVEGFNGLHCLQSLETMGVAINEGFAHFIAAKIFNEPQHDDCQFGYYKQFLFFGTMQPPINIDCEYPYHWMEFAGCVAPGGGVELDWLTFLWDLHAGDELVNFNISSLYWMFRLSCDPDHLDPDSPCGGVSPNFAMFENYVNGMPAAHNNRFDAAAVSHGVNH